MEYIQDFIYTRLPPSLLGSLTTHTSTYYRIYTTLTRARTLVLAPLNRIFSPLLARLLDEPDVASFLLLVLVLFISMKVLDYLWRTMLFWARMILRLAVVAALIGFGVWVWNRGVEGSFSDVRWIGQVWWQEYDGWKQRSEMASMRQQVGEQVAGGRARRGWR